MKNKQLPDDGFNESQIESILAQFANLDSNNFVGKSGAGEREGRVYSDMVLRRHFNLSHGIGEFQKP